MTHAYTSDPQSGAGNCTCGAAERDRRHPHMYLQALNHPNVCTCGLPPEAEQHVATLPKF